MKNFYSISIPKPCDEDWNVMTPKDKGRFCNSCSKTVIDFTKMNTYEIQDFINENKNNRICGHVKQTQLDSINIHIPSRVLEQRQSYNKLFLLALLISMGTSLFSCTNKNGNKQKIDSIEVIDTTNNKVINILGGIPKISETDSIPEKSCDEKSEFIDIETDGELVIETVGKIEINEPTGIITYEEEEEEEEIILGMITVETPPEFQDTPSNLSKLEKRDYFSKRIADIISKNFNTSVCLGLKGKQRVDTQFKIDEGGKIIDIKVRAPHPKLEDEAIRVIKLLPQFIPAKQRDKPIKMVYTLPIIFQAEE